MTKIGLRDWILLITLVPTLLISLGLGRYFSFARYQDLQQVIDWVVAKGEVPLFLILDGVTDIRNIGGIARTALCCGVQAIIIPDKGVGALNEDAILASAGALELIAVCRVNSLMKAVDDLLREQRVRRRAA